MSLGLGNLFPGFKQFSLKKLNPKKNPVVNLANLWQTKSTTRASSPGPRKNKSKIYAGKLENMGFSPYALTPLMFVWPSGYLKEAESKSARWLDFLWAPPPSPPKFSKRGMLCRTERMRSTW